MYGGLTNKDSKKTMTFLTYLGPILSGRLDRLARRGTDIFYDEKNFVPTENFRVDVNLFNG